MKAIARLAAACVLVLACGQGAAGAADGKIAVVAAENFYGDIARQIGGERVDVVSIMNNPAQDPHLFETTPGVVRQIANAKVVILNGASYDPWMDKLLDAAPRPNRIVLNAERITALKPGGNPHLWYQPATMNSVGIAITAALIRIDGANEAYYLARSKTMIESLERIRHRVTQLKAKHAGKAVTATEPVFGPMAEALGLTMRNERFQIAMMNDTEPSARDVAAFENDLKAHQVKLLIYNKQVSEKLTERLVEIARAAKVPVVGVTETMPGNVSFQDWMLGELDAVDKALSGPSS